MPFCTACSARVENKHWVGHLRSRAHKSRCAAPEEGGVVTVSSAFKGRIASYRILANAESESTLPDIFLSNIRAKLFCLIEKSLKQYISLKINVEYFGNFILLKSDAQDVKSFATKNMIIHRNFDYDQVFDSVVSTLSKKIEEFQERDSGWSFLSNLYVEININKFDPLSGAGSTYVDLPLHLKKKKACINIKNNDNFCFLWSVVAALYPTKRNGDRTASYPHFKDVLNINDLNFPVTFTDIKTFETNNKYLSINVYCVKNKRIVGPIYRSEFKRKTRINLLLVENGNRSHYVLIKNLSRLVRSQITKHHNKIYFCDDCLLFFPSEQKLDSHVCSGVCTMLPGKGSYLNFKNFNRKQDIPFVVYADFETLLKPIATCEPSSSCSFTLNQKQHIPAAFAYNIVCSFDSNLNRFVSYRGRDCVPKFLDCLYKDIERIYDILNVEVPMIFDENDAKKHAEAEVCHICNNLIVFDKVRDHCHLTGRYRGAAHQHCNLQYSLPKLIPVFFHNLAGYDCHLFIKELAESSGPIKVIPKNKENYISFTKFLKMSDSKFAQIRFVDSFKFLGTSLEKLGNGLHKTDFVHLRRCFTKDTEFELLTRKGVYPYDHMKSWKSYSEKHLPCKESFYNTLTDEGISDEDYMHAQLIWDTFNINNMGEYTDLYLKTDVYLLTDIFENFRAVCKKNYHLDPAFYLTAPSLSFDAMLLKTGVELELLSDLEIIRLVQKGVRGGICLCSTRLARANNSYMDDYDETKSDSFLLYIDCNNLYGYSMCQSLPISDFRFLQQYEIDRLQIMNMSDDAEYGFILEVDLLYPEELHCTHNDYPFCAEKFVPPGGTTSKLVPNLYSKYNYVIHYVHLKTCLNHGLILKKIHRVVTFKQSKFLAEYINLNTELRKKAVTPFQQDLFKLMNNSVFGKTLEDTERRVNVKLVNQWQDDANRTNRSISAAKLISRPNFHSASIFSENLVAVQMKPERIILDKPIYIGFAVLELSKSHMYQFHYSVIKPHYGNRVHLCYTDTDSFIYEIHTDDVYRDIRKHFLKYFDTSNYPSQNQYDLPIINKKIPGLFKDELGGRIMTEFVGLRSKLYCIKTESDVIKKAKGIRKNVIKHLNATDYGDVLLNDKLVRRKNVLFKCIKHHIFTQTVNKIALSNADDKRFIMPNKVSTMAWGHTSLI